MSAYRTDETEFTDEQCLVKALNERGYTTVEVHQVAQHLIGYHGDRRAEVAHVIVRRQYVGDAANDLGFVRGEDGKFRAIISDYDSHKHNAKWMTGLTDAYGEAAVVKQAARQGLRFMGKETKEINGKVRTQLKFADLSN
jgi:Protein of unknown function (DUF1257)